MNRLFWTSSIDKDNERGSVSLMTVLFALMLISATLLLFDASRRLNALTRAQDLASETARFAAASLDQDSVFANSTRISADAATNAEALAVAGGATAVTVTVSADGQSVTATVTVDGGTPIIPGFDLSAEGSHQALVVTP